MYILHKYFYILSYLKFVGFVFGGGRHDLSLYIFENVNGEMRCTKLLLLLGNKFKVKITAYNILSFFSVVNWCNLLKIIYFMNRWKCKTQLKGVNND